METEEANLIILMIMKRSMKNKKAIDKMDLLKAGTKEVASKQKSDVLEFHSCNSDNSFQDDEDMVANEKSPIE